LLYINPYTLGLLNETWAAILTLFAATEVTDAVLSPNQRTDPKEDGAKKNYCEGKTKDGKDCQDLNKDVQDAKKEVGKVGRCRPGMSRYELQIRKDAWVKLAAARARRDKRCWSGGDIGHQQAQADAWKNAGNCSSLMHSGF